MKPIRVEGILTAFSFLSLCLATYNLVRIIDSLSSESFFITTMTNWILFVVFIVVSVTCKIAVTHPELRAYFTHIERRGQQKKEKTPKSTKREEDEKKLPLY